MMFWPLRSWRFSSHLSIARTGFINGESYPLISKHLGEFVAKTVFYTSDYALGPSRKKEQVQKFINPELCKITEDLIFTIFFNAETNNLKKVCVLMLKIYGKINNLKFHVTVLKKSFLTEAEVLLHGDLHTGSIFASETETKVIDPEFAFYGPAGFDIGQYLRILPFN